MRKQQQLVNAVALTMLAGTMASAAVTVDGRITPGDNYGAAKWVNTVPTGFGDNASGSGGVLGDAGAAMTGVELAIPYSAIGYTGGELKISAFISGGGGFNSNQFLGSLPINTGNLGGNERNQNLDLIAGNQFASFTPADAPVPAIDGVKEGFYGPAKSLQSNYTGFGNNSGTDPVIASGSELNGLFVVRNDATQTLTVLFTGNLQNNGNRLNIFFDTVAGGQNRILQASGWGGVLTNLASDGGPNGFTFDAGFEADYGLSVNCTGGTTPTIYVDAAVLPTDVGGTSSYVGSTTFPSGAGFDAPVLMPGDPGAPAIRAAINNSNNVGVGGNPVALGNAAPNQFLAYGSEFNGVFAKIEGGKLFVLVTGNLESTFNKATFFFDVAAGGQNRLRAASNVLFNYVGNTEGDFNALQNMGGANTDFVLINPDDPAAGYTNTSGLKFDSDFSADYWFAVTNGGNTPESVQLYGNSAVLRTGGRRETTDGSAMDYRSYSGGLVNGNPPATTPSPVVFAGPTITPLLDPFGFPLSGDKEAQYAPRVNADVMANADPALRTPVGSLIELKLDNSNIGGVTATTGSAAAAGAVTTGMEFSIDLAELGWDGTSEIKLAGFITNDGYGFASNQIIGSSWDGTGTAPANAGTTRNVDFSNDTAFPGKQWISLTAEANPCPNPSNISGPGQNTTAIDGELTADDIIVFLNRFFAGNLLSDVSGPGQNTTAIDGDLTADDIIVFLNRFFAGC
ncbi:MAG: GC-type dockerin domain-anchored protein [bacterium]